MLKEGEPMSKKQPKGQSAYIYDDQATQQVSEQIMDSYNSGVIETSQMAYKANEEEERNQ